jgi:diketogulonate reductase-like aldo/keto reductase
VLAELEATLRVLVDAGGRVIDSSPMYGKSQSVAGTLSTKLGINDSLFVATKVWTSGEREGVAQMNASMRELHRTKIDLMQVHNLVDWRTHLATLRRWKEEGRIRYLGVTHYQASAFDELERVITRERIDFVQLPYSVGFRGAERRLLPAAASAGVAVLVNRPFEGGSLFRNALRTPLPEPVRAWAESWPQAFLKFVLAQPAVTCVIPGTGNPRHMRDNVQAGLGRLPTEREREELVRLLPT